MPRQLWGEPDGIPEGSDVSLEAVLTVNGVIAPAKVTSSGTYTLSIENTVQPVVPILADETSDAFTASSGLVRWDITAAQSALWPAGTFNGDIKLVDSGGAITYWPVTLKVRKVIDL